MGGVPRETAHPAGGAQEDFPDASKSLGGCHTEPNAHPNMNEIPNNGNYSTTEQTSSVCFKFFGIGGL